MMTQHSVGFVYVLGNDAMPGLVKIGRSSLLSEDRAKQQFTTGVPVPFDVLFRAVTSRPVGLEKAVHDLLAPHRVAPNREFFRISPEVAADSILKVRAEVDGLATWSAQSLLRLRSGDRLLLSMCADQTFVLLAYPELLASSATIIDVWQAHADGDTLEIYATDSPDHVAGLSDNDPGAEQDPVPFLNRTRTAANDMINGRERLVPGDRLLWMDASSVGNMGTSVIFEAYNDCQVISRTRDPQFSPEGFPLLLNVLTAEEVTMPMKRAVQEALALPMPRSWAPRDPEIAGGVSAPVSSAHWLPQLADRSRASRRLRRRKDTSS
jgi:hypothetical protein